MSSKGFLKKFNQRVPNTEFVRGIYIDKARIKFKQKASFVSVFHVAGNPDLYAENGSIPFKFPIDEVLSGARIRMGDDFGSLPIILSGRAASELVKRSRLTELFGERGVVQRRANFFTSDRETPLHLTGWDFEG